MYEALKLATQWLENIRSSSSGSALIALCDAMPDQDKGTQFLKDVLQKAEGK
jgi:hypothetical protein